MPSRDRNDSAHRQNRCPAKKSWSQHLLVLARKEGHRARRRGEIQRGNSGGGVATDKSSPSCRSSAGWKQPSGLASLLFTMVSQSRALTAPRDGVGAPSVPSAECPHGDLSVWGPVCPREAQCQGHRQELTWLLSWSMPGALWCHRDSQAVSLGPLAGEAIGMKLTGGLVMGWLVFWLWEQLGDGAGLLPHLGSRLSLTLCPFHCMSAE